MGLDRRVMAFGAVAGWLLFAACPTDTGSSANKQDVQAPDASGQDGGVSADVVQAPDVPVQVDVPVQADVPAQEDVPVQADVPAQQDVPVQADVPAQQDVAIQPDVPAQQDVAIQPDVPAQQDVASQPDVSAPTGGLVIDHTSIDLSAIPPAAIAQAKSKLHIAYQHTSHGSQIITGMDALEAFPAFGGLYAWDDGGQDAGALDLDDYGVDGCADLSQGDSVDANGDTPWVVATRALLDNPANSHLTTIVWSWCSINGHDAQRYVDNMEKLIAEYPSVTFVFLTGHAEGQGEDLGVNGVHYNNELIRKHCADHGRWLFDFADIEAHDPDGAYFWDQAMYDNLAYTDGNWAVQWCAAHEGSELEQLTTGDGVTGFGGTQGCAHSDAPQEANLNCVLKGRAAWWLWARLAGWNGQP